MSPTGGDPAAHERHPRCRAGGEQCHASTHSAQHGKRDPFFPFRLAERQREPFPGARVVGLKHSGHWPFLDDPEGVAGLVMVRTLNLDGDRQADLTVHGGAEKAVYGYPAEHYAFWREQLGEELPPGAFGENLTTMGLDEATLQIGDRLRIGAAELVVTQPRLPCFKLNLRFNRPDMVRRFLASRRTGFYFAVVKEGLVTARDPIIFLARDPGGVSVADITRVYAFDKDDRATMRRIVAAPALAEGWRTYFAERLAAAEAA